MTVSRRFSLLTLIVLLLREYINKWSVDEMIQKQRVQKDFGSKMKKIQDLPDIYVGQDAKNANKHTKQKYKIMS
jgi:hypothetical protein